MWLECLCRIHAFTAVQALLLTQAKGPNHGSVTDRPLLLLRRRTCGGHGYSKLSGLPTLFQNYVQNVTWEGDNNVLCLQTARYLIKALAGVAQGQEVQGSAAYLNNMQQLVASR